MKKLTFACIFLIAILGTIGMLWADSINSNSGSPSITSYNPNAPIKANAYIAREIKAKYARTGFLSSYEQQAINDYQAQTKKTLSVSLPGTRTTYTAYPQNVDYWTGSTSDIAKTQTSLVRGYDVEHGWFMFDISGIPVGSTINSVIFNGYVNSTNWPYWSLTPVSVDPRTSSAYDLYYDIDAEVISGYYLFQDESSAYTVGWKQHTLEAIANTNLRTALAQGWFAMGMATRDYNTEFYIIFDGWNETNRPYLTIDYTPPGAYPSPMDLVTTAITNSSAALGWTEVGGATLWDVEWGDSGFTQGTGTLLTGISVKPHPLSGLTPANGYDWYVRSNYGDGNYSSWSGPASFVTLPISLPYPWAENFEAGFFNMVNAPGNNTDWVLNTAIVSEGVKSAHNAYGNSSTNTIVTGSYFDLTGSVAPILSFAHIAKTETNWDHCYVEISTNNGSSWNILPQSTYQGEGNYVVPGWNNPEGPCFTEASYAIWDAGIETPDNTWWKTETFSLSDYQAFSTVMIRFRLKSDESALRYGWLIDMVEVKETGIVTLPGDNIANAFVIGVLPYSTTGTTVGYNHDYGPYGDVSGMSNLVNPNINYYSTETLGYSPDVVYQLTLTVPTLLSIDLLGSNYDTAVALVSAPGTNPANVFLINDDYYDAPVLFVSYVDSGCNYVPAGTYYIIIGGYGSNSGDYALTVTAAAPPVQPDVTIQVNSTSEEVILSWTQNPVMRYNIYSDTDPYGSFTNVVATGFDGATFTIYGIPAENTFYRVTERFCFPDSRAPVGVFEKPGGIVK